MRMTDKQIVETVEKMRASDEEKDALLDQVRRGDASARFVVYATYRRFQKEGR